MNFLWDNIFKRLEREQDIGAILANNILFRNLSKSELKFIEKIIHIRKYRAGETIFRQNENGVGMYIVVKGRVDISIIDEILLEPNTEKEVVVTRLEPGDFFGELSLVEEISRRSATAISSEDTVLIGFFKPDLLEILERSPSIGVKVVFRLAEVLGRRLKETTEKISQLKKEIRLLGELHEVQHDTRSATPENR
ncbi:MAG: cyclic nucleotide-binding domain-containing protein [Oligoflexia bacterium]|nr:cyclic nucleotide-binding domain-containing protein [Oligoflexia bacterium]